MAAKKKKKAKKTKAAKKAARTRALKAKICGPRKGKKRKAGKRKAAKKAGKRKVGKRKGVKRGKRRCAPCSAAANKSAFKISRGKSKSGIKNITCQIVKDSRGNCRRICFATVGKAMTKDGKWNPRAKRFLLDNRPAKGCGKKGRSVPAVILRGLGI